MSSKNRPKKPQSGVRQPDLKSIGQATPLWEKLFTQRNLFLLFAVAVLLFYAKPLFDSATSIQWDAVDVHYSSQKYLADQIHSGRLPFWTPYLYSGMPFLADPQVGAFYPPNWPFFLLGITPRSIEWELALHCLLALIGGYLLAKDMLHSRAAAIFAGVFYAFAGFFTGNSSHVAGFEVAALFPWLLLAGRRATQSAKWLPATAAVSGIMVLAGHFQMSLYAFSGFAIFLLAEWIVRRGPLRATALALLCAALAAVALPAVMVLPGLELTGQSERAVTTFAGDGGNELVPGALATLVSPNHYGAPDVEGYTGPVDVTQFYFYQGILLLPLVIWALIAAGKRWQSLAACLALVVIAAWYGFGRPAGLYSLTSLLPGFKDIRAPVNVWFVATMGLSLLAAAGISALRSRFRSPWIPLALLLFTAADVYYWNMDRNGLAYARSSFDDVYGAPETHFKTATADLTRDPLHRLYSAQDSPAFGPLNGSLDNRVEVTYGYNPLQPFRYKTYLDAAASNTRLLDALSTTAQLSPLSGTFAVNPSALPRIYAPDSATPVRTRQEAQSRLASLDPAHETVVEDLPAPMPQNAGAQAQITAYEGDRYRVHYQAPKSTLFRIAVPYFPGWRAAVDGRELKLMPADLALMAVVVPAGTHDLVLTYHSTWFLAGAALSLLSWLAVALWWRVAK